MIAAIVRFLPVLAGCFLIQIGYGLTGSLLPVRLAIDEAPAAAAGIVSAGYFGGLLLGTFAGQSILRRVGHIRAFAAFAGVAAAVVLLIALLPGAVAWTLLRFLSGLSVAGLYLIMESWLNMGSTNETRGTAFSTYMIVTYAGIGSSQFLLGAFDPSQFHLFAIASAAISLSIVPMTLTARAQPIMPRATRLRLIDLFRVSPVGMVGALTSGLLIGSIYGLLPFYFQATGRSIGEIGTLMAAAVFGGLAIAMPIGRLSDMIDRRLVIAGSCVTVVAVSMFEIVWPAQGFGAGLVFAAVFGAAAFPVYSLASAHTNDHVDPEDAIAAGAGLLLAYGIGAASGPLAASAVMSVVGPVAYFIYCAGCAAGLAIFVVYRITVRRAPKGDDKGEFIALSRTTPVAYEMAPFGQAEDDSVPPSGLAGPDLAGPGLAGPSLAGPGERE